MNLFVRFLNEYSPLRQPGECHCNDTSGLSRKLRLFDKIDLNKLRLNRMIVIWCGFLQGMFIYRIEENFQIPCVITSQLNHRRNSFRIFILKGTIFFLRLETLVTRNVWGCFYWEIYSKNLWQDHRYERLEEIQIFDWYILKEVSVKRRVSPEPEADDKLKRSTFYFPVQTIVCWENFSFLFSLNWITISSKKS